MVASALGRLVPLHHVVAGGLVYGARSRSETLIHVMAYFQSMNSLDHPVFAILVSVSKNFGGLLPLITEPNAGDVRHFFAHNCSLATFRWMA